MWWWRVIGAAGRTGSLAAALGLLLGLSASSARAANVVDVTYDLSDSRLVWENLFGDLMPVSNTSPFSMNGTVAGSMKVRYTSNSSSAMPIVHGPATLLTFNLTAKSLEFFNVRQTFPGLSIEYRYNVRLTGSLHWELTTPVTGSFKSVYRFDTTGYGNFLMTGRMNCLLTLSACRKEFGIPSFTIYPRYFHSGPVALAGRDGPYGGAQSTPHTLAGKIRGIRWRPGAALVALASDVNTNHALGGVYPIGREIVREAAGHPPKPIPEPTTMALLGGALCAVSAVDRMRRRRSARAGKLVQ